MMPMRATEESTLLRVRDLDGVRSALVGPDIPLISDPYAQRSGPGHRSLQLGTAGRGRILQHQAARRPGPGPQREAHHEGIVGADRFQRGNDRAAAGGDRKSTRLNSSHLVISYA